MPPPPRPAELSSGARPAAMLRDASASASAVAVAVAAACALALGGSARLAGVVDRATLPAACLAALAAALAWALAATASSLRRERRRARDAAERLRDERRFHRGVRARVRALLDAAVDAAGPARGPRSARDASDAGAARGRARAAASARAALDLARDRDHALARRDEPAETLATGDGDLLPWLPALVSSPSRARAASSARWRATRSANPEAFPRDRDPAAAAADAPARPPRHAAFTLDALIDAIVANTLANDASAVTAAVSRDDARGPGGSDRKPPLVDVSASVAPRAARRELRLVGVVSAYAACVAACVAAVSADDARKDDAERAVWLRVEVGERRGGVADLAARFESAPRRAPASDSRSESARRSAAGRASRPPPGAAERARSKDARAAAADARARWVEVRFVASAGGGGGGGEKARAAGSAPGVGALLGRGAFAATRDVVAALGGAVVDATTVRSDAGVRADRLVSIALAFPVLLASEASFDDSADDSDASDFDDSDFEGFDPASSSFSRNAADGVGARESPIAVLHPSLGAPRRAHARGMFEGGEIRVREPATDAECAAYFESDVDAEGAEDAIARATPIARARASRAPVGRPPVALVASSAALETAPSSSVIWRAAAAVLLTRGRAEADALDAEIASGALRGRGFVALASPATGEAYREAVRAALEKAAAARPTRAAREADGDGDGGGGRGRVRGREETTTTTTTTRRRRRPRAKAAKAAAAFAAERADAALDARFRTTPPARGDSAASSSPTRRVTPGSVSAGVPLAASPAPASSLEGGPTRAPARARVPVPRRTVGPFPATSSRACPSWSSRITSSSSASCGRRSRGAASRWTSRCTAARPWRRCGGRSATAARGRACTTSSSWTR